jgi:tetratricopeptide (TPR) repeat protein
MKSTDEYVGAEIGNYRIGDRIACGGFGTVYYGHHKLLPRSVAIKVLHTMYLASPKERDRFLQEAQLLEELEHPHCLPVYDAGVLSVHDAGVDHEIPYLISKYAAHGSLRDCLKKAQGPFSPEDVLDIVAQVAEALHYAHQHGVIHRDLKPENILFDEHDNVLLADFGLAMVSQATSVQSVSRAGTPDYMAPEQFEGIVSRRSDQYALGCITYELLTGHLPYSSSSDHSSNPSASKTVILLPPSIYNPLIPLAFERALLKSLERQRKDRYDDIVTFLNALQTSLTSSALAPNASSPIALREERIAQPPLLSWIEQGKKLLQGQRFEEALKAYQQAIRLDLRCEAALVGKAEALSQLKRYQEAFIAYEQAIALNAASLHAHLGKAALLLELKRYKEAYQAYVQIIRLAPNNVEAHLGKEYALMELKRYDEALAVCHQAIKLDPHDARAYNCRGCAFLALGRYQRALDDFEQALRLDATYGTAFLNKGIVLERLGSYEAALAAYKHALELSPYNASLYRYKGYALYHLGAYEEALAAFEQAILLNPDETPALLGISQVLLKLGYFEEALSYCERTLLLDPAYAAAYDQKGRLLRGMGKVKEANQAFERAKQLGFYEQ